MDTFTQLLLLVCAIVFILGSATNFIMVVILVIRGHRAAERRRATLNNPASLAPVHHDAQIPA